MKGITFQAMGTLILFKVSEKTPDAVLETVRRMVLDFEHRFSANADDSILADLKRHAGIRPIQVDTDIFQLIKVCKHYSLQPGFLNIAIGPLVHLWRIGFGDARKPNDAEIQEALRLIKPENIILDEENRTVFLTEPGMSIDLGSLAKGFFADIIKQYFQQQGVQSALINLGGNIVVMSDGPSTADGYDPEFGKIVFELTCEVAPFYATPRRPALHHTMGGLKIDKQTHVINTNGRIAGLNALAEKVDGVLV